MSSYFLYQKPHILSNSELKTASNTYIPVFLKTLMGLNACEVLILPNYWIVPHHHPQLVFTY